MKAVMISIQPKWVEKIATEQKTIEVRKTRPKIDTPFKCYIYCTKVSKSKNVLLFENSGECVGFGDYRNAGRNFDGTAWHIGNGKVIGEFVCDRIEAYPYDENIKIPTPMYDGDESCIECGAGYYITCGEFKKTCLTDDEFDTYGNGKTLYGWHISDLVIYDEPKELSEFWAYNAELNKRFNDGEDYCAWGSCETENGCTNDCDTENILHCYQCWEDWSGWCHKLTRPPESWQFVEEKENNDENKNETI